MKSHNLTDWQHSHDFGTAHERHAERRTRWVVALTFFAMVVELIAGWLSGSMALLADGWHMASHVGALGLAAFAYRFARRHADDARYTFGTGKVTALAGYSSALLLGAIAFWMVWESVSRLFAPVAIHYTEAMIVAAFGLVVNLASAWLLDHDHDHDHHHADHHDHDHGHGHEHVDHNLRAAYLHVLADALTSLLAIFALLGGKYLGLNWLDPAMGVVGAILVARWSIGLLKTTSRVLLDHQGPEEIRNAIRQNLEELPGVTVVDLHLWQIGPGKYCLAVALTASDPRSPDHYRPYLPKHAGLAHVTIEVQHVPAAGKPAGHN